MESCVDMNTPTKNVPHPEDLGLTELQAVVNLLLEIAHQLRLDDLENLCRRALGTQAIFTLEKINSVVHLPRKTIVSFIASMGIDVGFVTALNHSVRFRKSGENSRRLPLSAAVFGSSGYREYEDVTSTEILNAPICDMLILQRGDILPQGYYRISLSPSGRSANLNFGSGGSHLFLCIKKDVTGEGATITALSVLFPSRGEYLLPGYSFVKRQQLACDLNFGSNAERIYLCYKKEKYGNPIFDIQPFFPGRGEEPPRNFQVIERSQRNFVADLNTGTASHGILLAYRQHLRKLDCLEKSSRVHQCYTPTNDRLSQRLLSPMSSHSPATSLAQPVQRARSQSYHPVATFNKISTEFKPITNASKYEKVTESNGSGSDIAEGEKSTPQENMSEDDLHTAERQDVINMTDVQVHIDDHADNDTHKLPPSLQDVVEDLVENHDCESSDGSFELNQQLDYIDRYTDVVVREDGQIVDENVRKLTHPVLVALYVRSAPVYECAISGLQSVLDSSSLFSRHLLGLAPYGCKSLVDVVVDTICDRFDAFVDTQSEPSLKLLLSVIIKAKNQLSMFSLQRSFQTLTMICAYYATDPHWLSVHPSEWNVPLTRDKNPVYAFRVLCSLVHSLSEQADALDAAQSLPRLRSQLSTASAVSSQGPADGLSDHVSFIHEIVMEWVIDVADSVESATLFDRIQFHIRKSTSSTSGSALWEELSFFSKKAFRDHSYQCCFVALSALCKMSILDVRNNNNGFPIPRDLGNKLFALDSIREFLNGAGDNLKQSKTMGYMVRRIIVPSLIRSVEFSLREIRVFILILKNMTALWKNWRAAAKTEFAILCDHLLFRVLQVNATRTLHQHQVAILDEIVNWFDIPNALFEIFVNYDFDRDFVVHFDLFEKLTRAISDLASNCMVTTMNNQTYFDHNHQRQSQQDPFHEVVLKALDVILIISKTLMDAAGHAHLIGADEGMQLKSLNDGCGWDAAYVDDTTEEDPSSLATASPRNIPQLLSTAMKATKSVRNRHEKHVNSSKLLKRATSIYHDKGLIKAVRYLIDQNFMNDTPQDVASFLMLYRNNFDPSAIGDILGEGGRTPTEEKFWDEVRYRYTRATSFTDMTVEQALRKYLTCCGFRLPGEGQKVDRFVTAFVKVFWQDNKGTPYAPFVSEDTVHVCVYAIIMLNTDLHRATRDKRRAGLKMTKDQFINNLRHTNVSMSDPTVPPRDIDRNYLSVIYDTIAKSSIEMAVESSEAKEKDVERTNRFERTEFTANVVKGLSSAEDSLRSLSKYVHRFSYTGVDVNISLDMIRFMFENAWHHFHKVTAVLVNSTVREQSITYSVLDLLKYTLTCCIFLGTDVKLERDIFSTQLAKFKMWLETYKKALSSNSSQSASTLDGLMKQRSSHKRIQSGVFTQGNHLQEEWFENISNVTPESAMDTAQAVLVLVNDLKETFKGLSSLEKLRSVVTKIDKKADILRGNTSFIREGDLAKFNRKGKMITYHFFLFSDTLLYTHQEYLGGYKVHSQMDLKSMSIHDVEDDQSGCCFSLSHPTKSFIVAAETPAARQAWMRDLTTAITECISVTKSNTNDLAAVISSKSIPDNDCVTMQFQF